MFFPVTYKAFGPFLLPLLRATDYAGRNPALCVYVSLFLQITSLSDLQPHPLEFRVAPGRRNASLMSVNVNYLSAYITPIAEFKST